MQNKISIPISRLQMEAIANAIQYKMYDAGSLMSYVLMDLEDTISDSIKLGLPEWQLVDFEMRYKLAEELLEIIKYEEGLELVSRILELKLKKTSSDEQEELEVEEDCGCGEEDVISVEFTTEQLQAVWNLMVDNNRHDNPLEPLIDQIGEYLQSVENHRWYELSDFELWELYKEGFGEKNIQEIWFDNVVSREEIIQFLQEIEA